MVFVPFPSAGRRLSVFMAGASAPPLQRAEPAAAEVHTLPRLFAFRTALYLIVAAIVLNTFMTRWRFRARSPRYGFKALGDLGKRHR